MHCSYDLLCIMHCSGTQQMASGMFAIVDLLVLFSMHVDQWIDPKKLLHFMLLYSELAY